MRQTAGALLAAALLAAALLRIPRLSERPMHGDEAIQAFQASELWKGGKVCYDPCAYHGPVLHYAVLPVLALSRASNLAETSENHFRIVPACFGIAVLGLVWLMAGGLNAGSRLPAAVAAFLLALSPSMAYYSRYFIQETLLVFFTGLTLAAGWKYAESGRKGWLYGAAVSAGAMLATKETAWLAFAAMAAALALTAPARLRVREMTGPALAGLGTAALLISGLLTHPENAVSALRAPFHYARLAASGGDHVHPWYYYIKLISYSRPGSGPAFSEAAILALAAAGAWFAFRGRAAKEKLPRFLAVYALILAVLYSAIPYKTPWCMLSFLYPLILLAGSGAVRLFEALPRRFPPRAAYILALSAAFAHLAWQAHRANFVYPSDRRNPYVYAHPVPDVIRLAKQIRRLAGFHPAGEAMPVAVIGADCWPLPWYLRSMTRVGYWQEPPPVLVQPVVVYSADAIPAITGRLRGPYEDFFYGLRPDRILKLCVKAGLWEKSLGRSK